MKYWLVRGIIFPIVHLLQIQLNLHWNSFLGENGKRAKGFPRYFTLSVLHQSGNKLSSEKMKPPTATLEGTFLHLKLRKVLIILKFCIKKFMKFFKKSSFLTFHKEFHSDTLQNLMMLNNKNTAGFLKKTKTSGKV